MNKIQRFFNVQTSGLFCRNIQERLKEALTLAKIFGK